MDAATLTWVLTGAVVLLYGLGATIFKMLRDESKVHAEAIKLKADMDRLRDAEAKLHSAETRWKDDLEQIRHDSERLFDKQEARHEKQNTALEERLSTQIKTSETNILQQMSLLFSNVNSHK